MDYSEWIGIRDLLSRTDFPHYNYPDRRYCGLVAEKYLDPNAKWNSLSSVVRDLMLAGF